ncbi:hypothetical protein AB4Y45_40980 [Paraburkholderia sp. EG287A]|uniref:hypothetical protein n=1 Tax=unclassified Paraburkholderia TaxID=2615204 RepID=UPI0034D1BC2B
MPTRTKQPSTADLSRCQLLYVVELARGSSHIDSTLTVASRKAAISEILSEFEAWYGTGDIPAFVEILARRLEERANPDAASAVRECSRADRAA